MKAPSHNELFYLKFTLVAIAYFMIMHLIIHLLATRFTQIYHEMNTLKQTEYRTYVLSPLHSIAAVIMSVWAMWFVCGDDKTVFNDEECMNTVRYIHIWAVLHSCGYFMVDFFWAYVV